MTIFQVDPQRITQIMINLLTNAIKFTATSDLRHIQVNVDASYNVPEGVKRYLPANSDVLRPRRKSVGELYLIFSVSDTGKGVSEEDAARLFQRFQQGHPRTTQTYGGSGLGLFICKKLVNRLGGDIWLESQLGKGTNFTFFIQAERCHPPLASNNIGPLVPLDHEMTAMKRSRRKASIDGPLTSATAATSAKIASPSPISQKAKPGTNSTAKALRILLTEDNIINQQLLRRQLTKAGCEVAVANNGLEALDHILLSDASIPGGVGLDCILMDIEMPKMGGIECTRRIRDLEAEGVLLRRTPIIAVTANVRSGQVEQVRGNLVPRRDEN